MQPLKEIGRVTRAAGVPLHVDGVGALGRVPLNVEAMGIDLLTISGNDLYGPPGERRALGPARACGSTRRCWAAGRRAATARARRTCPALVGLGVAAELMRVEGAHQEAARLAALRDRLMRRAARGDSRLPR